MLDVPPLREGESGGKVVDDETESSTSSVLEGEGDGDDSRMVDKTSDLSACFDNIFCLMRICENGVLCGRGGVEYSSTVARIDCVISSLDV